jgi:hypothetical protein
VRLHRQQDEPLPYTSNPEKLIKQIKIQDRHCSDALNTSN